MVRRLQFALISLALGLISPPDILIAQSSIPDTLAGRALASWMEAFNSGDRPRMDAFQHTFQPNDPESLIDSPQFRRQSGGVTLLSIQDSQADTIAFRLQEKAQPSILIGRIVVDSAQPDSALPAAIRTFSLRAVPPDAVPDDLHLNAASRKQVIEDVITNLNESYVDSGVAEKMAAALRSRQARGDYQRISDGDDFANTLTQNLLEISHDKHLRVFYNPYKWNGGPTPLTPEQSGEARRAMSRDCGFRKIDVLPNNIGLVKLDFFPDLNACERTTAAAITFLSGVDAVIFDLRDNGGGDPRMVAFLSSYLFDQQVHLDDLWDRRANTTTEYWTFRYVPGTRLGRKPVYILTSRHTFSGAEEFAYDMKLLKRATIVGETTAGAAHPVSAYRAGDHFTIYVPCARSTNPISKTDWEQTGVSPDISVSAASALDKAAELASADIQNTILETTSQTGNANRAVPVNPVPVNPVPANPVPVNPVQPPGISPPPTPFQP
jgi:hypothetical protein